MIGSSKVVVVGATSGIGRALVRQLAARGDNVVGIGRREDRLSELQKEYPQNFIGHRHDVRDLALTPSAFQSAVQSLNGLDIIIYAAGVMPQIALTEYCTEKDAEIMLVNVTAGMAWINASADYFQSIRAGTIVGIGSVAGDRGRMGQPAYNASKAAFATYLEAIRNRLAPFGVNVVTVKPGPVQTEMTSHLELKGALTADDAAARIIRRLHRNGEFYLVPSHRLIFGLLKRIPSGIFRRLKLQ
jgi:short-subunit dehydrogenase